MRSALGFKHFGILYETRTRTRLAGNILLIIETCLASYLSRKSEPAWQVLFGQWSCVTKKSGTSSGQKRLPLKEQMQGKALVGEKPCIPEHASRVEDATGTRPVGQAPRLY